MYSDLLGKPFAWGGRGPESYDCFGLCKEVFRRKGIELPDYQSNPEFQIIDERLAEGRSKYLLEIDKAENGCIVLFKIKPPFVSHIGVMVNATQFIHITQKSSVSVERVDSLLWANKVHGFYRFIQ